MKLNAVQANPDLRKTITDYIRKQRDDNAKFFFEAHKKAKEKAKKNNAAKKTGMVRISNTDTVERCVRIKSRLAAKLMEIYASDLDDKMKSALARNVLLEMSKVEQKISDIRRRERAAQEEKENRKDESEHVKRRRRHDLEKRSVVIRRDYLYSAEKGGFDPNDLMFGSAQADFPAASFDISGVTGEVSVSQEAATAVDASV